MQEVMNEKVKCYRTFSGKTLLGKISETIIKLKSNEKDEVLKFDHQIAFKITQAPRFCRVN